MSSLGLVVLQLGQDQFSIFSLSERPVSLYLKAALSVGFLPLVFCDVITRFSQSRIIQSKLQIDELLIFDAEEVEV